MQPVVEERRLYVPRGSAVQLFNSRAPEILISGPAGTGKSRACLEKIHHAALKYEGASFVIIRKVAQDLLDAALDDFQKKVIPEAVKSGEVTYFGGSKREGHHFKYGNQSTITTGGMDRSNSVMSKQYDMAYVQEATELSEKDWQSISMRLRHGRMPYQQLIADCNPDAPTHWLKRRTEVIDEKTGKPKTLLLSSTHEENPVLFETDGTPTEAGVNYLSRLDSLTGEMYDRYRLGLWVAADGVVYKEYLESVHVVDRFDIPNSWTRYWSIDFGFTNPFVCQMWAEDHDGRLFMYREFYQTQRKIDEMAQDILASVKDGDVWKEPKPRAIITDHDAGERAILERELGISTTAAHKSVEDGIQAVQMRMRVVGDGKPRIMLLRGSLVTEDKELKKVFKPTSTQAELPRYVWDKPKDRAPKEVPLKLNDHGCDAMRYMVAEIDLVGRPSLRFV